MEFWHIYWKQSWRSTLRAFIRFLLQEKDTLRTKGDGSNFRSWSIELLIIRMPTHIVAPAFISVQQQAIESTSRKRLLDLQMKIEETVNFTNTSVVDSVVEYNKKHRKRLENSLHPESPSAEGIHPRNRPVAEIHCKLGLADLYSQHSKYLLAANSKSTTRSPEAVKLNK